MNTDQLKTFLSLVETKSFSRTAKNMVLAQSTVSKRISELENEVGQELFIRDRTGTKLTMAGKSLLEYAEQIVNMEEKAKEQIHRKSKYEGYLEIGTVYAYFEVYLNKILQTFMEKHPEISIKISLGHTGHIISNVRRALLDVVFVHHPFEHPEYVCQLIEEDDVILVTDSKNKTYHKGISHREIKHLPLISSNFLYETTHSWLFPLSQQFQLEMDIAKHTIPFLKDTKWYTLLARRLVKHELESGGLIEIPVLDADIPTVQYYMVYRKDNIHQMAVKEWVNHLKQ